MGNQKNRKLLKRVSWLCFVVFLIYLRFFSNLDGKWVIGIILAAEAIVIFKVIQLIRKSLNIRHIIQNSDIHALEEGLKEYVPSWFAIFFATEICIILAFIRLVKRRPLVKPTEPTDFTFLRTSSYSAIILCVILLSVIEVPLAHILIHYYVESSWANVWHVLLFAFHVYGFIWIAGEYRLMQESHHFIDERGFHISLGLRFNGFVPYEAINSVEPLASGSDDKFQPRIPKISAFDEANVVLHLKEKVELKRMFGFKKRCDEMNLYLDDPNDFIASVQTKLEAVA